MKGKVTLYHEEQTTKNKMAPDNDRIKVKSIDSGGVKGMSEKAIAELAEAAKVVCQQNHSKNIRGGVISSSLEL